MRFHAAPPLLQRLLLPLLAFSSLTEAVFQDEAFHTDFHVALLGLPIQAATFFHQPTKGSKASLLFSLSERGVLGAVNPKDGGVVWRQDLSGALSPAASSSSSTDGEQERRVTGSLRAGEGEDVVVSAVGGGVRAWEGTSGRAVWANEFEGLVRDLEVLEMARDGNGRKDSVVVNEEGRGGVVRRVSGDTGAVVWEVVDKSGDIPFQVSSDAKAIYLVSLPTTKSGYRIKVTSYDPPTGKQVDQYTLHSETDVSEIDNIIYVGANLASPIIAWTDKTFSTLKVNIIGSKTIHTLKIDEAKDGPLQKIVLHAPHITTARPHFLVHFQSATTHWADVYHINVKKSTVEKSYSLPKVGGNGAFSTSTQDANVYFTRNTATEVVLVSSASHGILGRWPLKDTQKKHKDLTHPLQAVSEVVSKSSSNYAVRSAVLTSIGDWVLIRNGEAEWSRTESLAEAVGAVWAELEEYQDLAQELDLEAHQNPLSAYVHRVKRHIHDLQYFPAWLQGLPERIVGNPEKEKLAADGPLHQDAFGFRKLVIVATSNGRLYALDALHQGRIIWSIQAVNLPKGTKWDVKGMSTSLYADEVTVIGSSGDETVVKTTTGEILRSLPVGSSPGVEAMLLVTGEKRKSFINVYAGGETNPMPVEESPKENTVIVTKSATGTIKGLMSAPQGKLANSALAWEFSAPLGSRIVSLSHRPAHDPVSNIGKVLGDRTVLYKYINQNLLLVTSADDTASTLTVTLLDAITGNVLYTASTPNVDTSRPIVSTMSENWFVYTYTAFTDSTSNSDLQSNGPHLTISELFESAVSNDRGPLGESANYSSIAQSELQPYVLSSSFVTPSEVAALSVTQTSQGITSRNLLLTLSSGGLVALPLLILDPRRPVSRNPTPAEVEDQMLKYNALLEFPPTAYLTHKLETLGLKKIITSPALLESTSLVFAYGDGDLFGTRVQPSGGFDFLGKGFGKMQLIGTVIALAGLTGFMGPIMRKKQVDTVWTQPS